MHHFKLKKKNTYFENLTTMTFGLLSLAHLIPQCPNKNVRHLEIVQHDDKKGSFLQNTLR